MISWRVLAGLQLSKSGSDKIISLHCYFSIYSFVVSLFLTLRLMGRLLLLLPRALSWDSSAFASHSLCRSMQTLGFCRYTLAGDWERFRLLVSDNCSVEFGPLLMHSIRSSHQSAHGKLAARVVRLKLNNFFLIGPKKKRIWILIKFRHSGWPI